VNWRLQITDGGGTAEPVVFSSDSAYDDAVAFIGVTMILAAARTHKFSVDIEPVDDRSSDRPSHA
jgi:hypothetical protein